MMDWTPEHRRHYGLTIDHVVRSSAITWLVDTIDMIDPPLVLSH
jgi:hypothetical protein